MMAHNLLKNASTHADALNDRHGVNALRDALVDAGLLIPMGVAGLYGRSETFERVVSAVDALVTRLGADQHAEALRFPPAMNRTDFEHSEYLKGFPSLPERFTASAALSMNTSASCNA
jgi:hypothetical protein